MEKRFGRSYKISNSHYEKAMKRAKKNKTALATEIEKFVIQYGEPQKVFMRYPENQNRK